MENFKDFDTFILEDYCSQKKSAVETALSQVIDKFGSLKNPKEFLKNVKENGGVDGLRNCVINAITPLIPQILAQEKFSETQKNYDDILRGLISSCIIELQLKQLTKDEKSK